MIILKKRILPVLLAVLLVVLMTPITNISARAAGTVSVGVTAPAGVKVWYRTIDSSNVKSSYADGTGGITFEEGVVTLEIILGEDPEKDYDYALNGVTGSIRSDMGRASDAPGDSTGTAFDVSSFTSSGTYSFTITEHISSPTIKVSYDASNDITNGNLQYKTSSGGAWIDIGSSGLSSNTDAYAVRAVSLVSGYNLASCTEMRVNGNSESIPGDFTSDAGLVLDNGKNYEFEHVAFMRGSSPSNTARGKYRVTVSHDFEGVSFTGAGITVSFLDASDTVIGSFTTNSDVSETAIPSGAVRVKVDGADDDSTYYCANARLRQYDGTDANLPEIDLIDDIMREDDMHPGYAIADINPSLRGYEITIEFSNKKNVGWTYDTSDSRQDMVVENCTIQLLDASGQPMSGTDHNLIIGQDYEFLLVPEYGYQVVGLNVNGYAITPQDETGVFKFTMSNSNFHFQGIVAPAEDIIDTDNSGLVSAANISGGENAADSGNLKMTITDAETDWNALADLNRDGAEMIGTVDINLDQVTSKGDGSYWSDNITEFNDPVNISLDLSGVEVAADEEIVIIREHNGVETVLDTAYDAATGIASVDSNMFSSYTIVKVKKSDNGGANNGNSSGGSSSGGNSSGGSSSSQSTPSQSVTPLQITPSAQTPIDIQVVETPVDTPVQNPDEETSTENPSPRTGESRLPFMLYASGMSILGTTAIVMKRKCKRY